MSIASKEIDYFTFAQEIFKGKDIYDKDSGKRLQKWEAYVLIHNCWELVLDGIHHNLRAPCHNIPCGFPIARRHCHNERRQF